jgi:hypothetical protein
MIDGWREELVAEEHRKNERITAQWTRRLGWFTAVFSGYYAAAPADWRKFTAICRASSRVSRFGRRAVRRSDMSGIGAGAEARVLHLKRN